MNNLFEIWDLEFGIFKKNAMHYALCVFCGILVVLPRWGMAQGIFQGATGSLEFNYSFFTSKTTDASGVTTKTETSNYNPRFTLNIDTKIYPNLKLHAGGIAEGNISDFSSDGTDTKTTVTRFRPYIDLTLETPLYTAGMGYIRREEKTKTEDSPSVTLINEEYNGVLRWRPEGLPYIDSQVKRTFNYDSERLLRDTREDFVNLVSRYTYRGLELNYQGTQIHTIDNLNDLEVKQFTHSGRVAYSSFFFNKRVSLSATYDGTYNVVKTLSEGQGFVSFQLFPSAGLSALDDSSAEGALLVTPTLIDGNLTASAGIDIGVRPIGEGRTPRNIGLDFLNVTEVNQLLVWVDRELPTGIANSFSWQVWTSPDNLNWSLFTTVSPATFGPFENRFEVNFSSVRTRFIKVVTDPLSPAVPGASSFPNIFVTEIQAFLERPAEDVEGTVRRASHTLNLDMKARILNTPNLAYELYYFFNRLEPSAEQRYTVSNGFSINHRFSRIFSTTARVAREDGKEEDEKRTAYVYNAAIMADPLRTLRNSLVFSGRDEEIGGRPNDTKSFFLYNTAQLYPGIDVNLNGGLSFATRETGEKTRDITINFGANVVPHRAMTIALNYGDTMSKRSGGGRESSSTFTRRLDINLSYNPLRTLYLAALIQVVAEKGRDIQTTQNYGINWSPFPDGALQFNVAYNENLRSEDNSKERLFTPSVRWNITKRSYLDLSYQLIRSESEIQKTDSNVISTSVKIFY